MISELWRIKVSCSFYFIDMSFLGEKSPYDSTVELIVLQSGMENGEF